MMRKVCGEGFDSASRLLTGGTNRLAATKLVDEEHRQITPRHQILQSQRSELGAPQPRPRESGLESDTN
jgi:hypothetical protein